MERLRFSSSVEEREGPEEVAGGAVLVGVADELGVELLVALQGEAAALLVLVLQLRDIGVIDMEIPQFVF